MTVLEVLKQGRERIEKGWCQGAYAIDAHGNHAKPYWRRAVAWCAEGACNFGKINRKIEAIRVLESCAHSLKPIYQWNDQPRRTHRQVLMLFDRAIAKAEKQEKKLKNKEPLKCESPFVRC